MIIVHTFWDFRHAVSNILHTHTGPFYNWSRPLTRRGVIYVIFEASQQKMEFLAEEIVYCPYCGEALDVLIDRQEVGQQY